jgi:hypothetical protein
VSAPAELPPFGQIAAALRRTTERLALELAAPQESAPAWNEFEWQVARAVASLQGISMLLAPRLRWRGPESWQDFLDAQGRLARERHVRIGAALARLDDVLREAGVACVALKGSALRSLHLYQPGERPMGDIDLLARTADAPRVAQALESLGYALGHRTRRHAVFEPPRLGAGSPFGEHPDNPLKVELHEVIAEPLPIRPVDITASLWRDAARAGLVAYPHARELMRHLLLHAAGNMRAHALRLIQLHDIAVLAGQLGNDDWQGLLDTPESRGGSWWMWPVLELTGRCFPGSLPALCLRFRARCPRLLRVASTRTTLTEVSWSNLRIAALPGVCWSRSGREAAVFMRSRLFPRRAALDDLAAAVESMPVLRAVPWYGESQFRRVLRWIFSRPPRVQTLVSLQAACNSRPVGS